MTSWPHDAGGTMTVRAIYPDGTAEVEDSQVPGFLYRYRTEELARLREVSATNVAYRAREAVRARVEELARQGAESLDGFEMVLGSPMAIGRAKKTLLLVVLYRGAPISRRDLIRRAVREEGAKASAFSGKPAIEFPDGRFLVLPKIAVDYAEFLCSRLDTGGPTVA